MPRKIVGVAAATTLAPLLSAGLLVAAFPKIDFSWSVWLGLVPLLLSITEGSSKRSFFLAYACGIVFFCGVFSWSFEIPGYGIQHQVILAIYLGLYFGIFGGLFSFLANRLSIFHGYLAAPFIWVTLEYVRSTISILSLPWPMLSHSQYQHLYIIQIASLTGAYGVSFLIVSVNTTVAALLHPLIKRDGSSSDCSASFSQMHLWVLSVCSIVLTSFVLGYGHASLKRPVPERSLHLSVLQGNISQEIKKIPRKNATFIMDRYAQLTEKAMQDNPDLIIWPEAATPGLVLKHMGLYTQLTKLIRSQGTHFLIGSSEYPKFKPMQTDQHRAGNTALFFSPEGKVLGQYLKIRLLPFGEYIPFEKTISWPRFIIDSKRNWDIPGKDIVLFKLDAIPFGVIICWENAFPTLFRKFVKGGARFMVNITNEGWFGESAAPYQFLAMSVYRAVENRVSLIRAANTGISCFIDPDGRIVGRVRTGGKDIYVDGYLTRPLRVSQANTVYTRYGDVFVFVNMLMVAGLTMVALRRPKKRPVHR